MERMEEMLILSNQLDFRDVSKAVPLISASRWLVKRGEVTRVWWKDGAAAADGGASTTASKLTFGRSRVNRQQLHLFLFTDLLVVAKQQKGGGSKEDGGGGYAVVDHCPRNLVTLAELEPTELTCISNIINSNKKSSSSEPESSSSASTSSSPSSSAAVLSWLTLLQSHENKTVEWLVSFGGEADRAAWSRAVCPPQTSALNPDEKIYEAWDCPQVRLPSHLPTCIFRSITKSRSFLTLPVGGGCRAARSKRGRGRAGLEEGRHRQCA